MNEYTKQLADKQCRLNHLFAGIDMPKWEIFDSPEQHYRMRAEFRIWHDNDSISYAMFEKNDKARPHVIKLTTFQTAYHTIADLMPILLTQISAQTELKNRLYQCEFLSTLSGEILVTLIYHRQLDEAWQMAARALQEQLGIMILGRSKKQKIVLTQDFVTEQLQVNGKTYRYRQIEGSFTQPNAVVCQKMLTWASDCAQHLGGDLLELYCGNGNFTLPLAQHFQHVLATEVSKTSVAAAQWNILENQAQNIKIARLSAEEFTQAMQGKREFKRLKESQIELSDYQFSTIFVDPPRAGIDEKTLQLMQQFEHIIYISCNPETLRDNLNTLCQTHQIQRAALFDQFPFTPHIESGVWLTRR